MLSIGEVVADRFELRRELGAGGFGAVFLAADLDSGGEVALKVMLPELAPSDKHRRRFKREIDALSRLVHPSIVGFVAAGKSRAGWYLAMEYVRGNELRDQLRELRGADRADDDVRRLVGIFRDIARGLDCAHRLGIVHRDLKPDNVICETDASGAVRARVFDFGIAWFVGSDLSERLTTAGKVIGTPSYMAPEQMRGGAITEKTDIWAFGVMAYEAFADCKPFRGDLPTLLRAITTAPPPDHERFAALPRAIKTTVFRCLSKEPRERPDAGDLAALFGAEIDGEVDATTLSDVSGGTQVLDPSAVNDHDVNPPKFAAAPPVRPNATAKLEQTDEVPGELVADTTVFVESDVDEARDMQAAGGPQHGLEAAAASENADPTAIVDAPDPLAPGSVVDGVYEIADVLASGGNGVVYRARNNKTDGMVALKCLRTDKALADSETQRLQQEVRTLAKLSHPNTVRVYDCGATDSGEFYVVMELLRGRTLQSVIKNHAPLRPARAARIARQVLSALSEAHGQRVVHRDLKPGNVILLEQGGTGEAIKLIDFGIAKRTDGAGLDLTQDNTALGTPTYMAPEQIVRQDGAAIGPATDIYAAGVVLYEMLAGRPPFVADTAMAMLYQHMNEAPRDLADHPSLRVPKRLAALVAAMLAKDPANRPSSCTDAIRELDAIFPVGAGSEVADKPSASPPSVAANPSALSSRKPVGLWAGGAVLAAVALAAVVYGTRDSGSEPVEKPAAAETPAVESVAKTAAAEAGDPRPDKGAEDQPGKEANNAVAPPQVAKEDDDQPPAGAPECAGGKKPSTVLIDQPGIVFRAGKQLGSSPQTFSVCAGDAQFIVKLVGTDSETQRLVVPARLTAGAVVRPFAPKKAAGTSKKGGRRGGGRTAVAAGSRRAGKKVGGGAGARTVRKPPVRPKRPKSTRRTVSKDGGID